MSIVRASPADRTRRLIVLACAIFAVVIGQWQALTGWGQTTQEFSADSDATLRVAGWAFSIWGVIYTWLLVYAVRQVLPQTGESEMIHRFGWPSVIALLCIGWWIPAMAFDVEWATIVLIVSGAMALIAPLLVHARLVAELPSRDRDRWMTAWPLGLLAGWLTIASVVNIITVVTGNGQLPDALSPTAWAMLGVAFVTAMAVFVTWRTRLLAYSLPIAWGLTGVFGAEQERNGALAFTALGAAALILVVGVILSLRLSRRGDVTARPTAAGDRP